MSKIENHFWEFYNRYCNLPCARCLLSPIYFNLTTVLQVPSLIICFTKMRQKTQSYFETQSSNTVPSCFSRNRKVKPPKESSMWFKLRFVANVFLGGGITVIIAKDPESCEPEFEFQHQLITWLRQTVYPFSLLKSF